MQGGTSPEKCLKPYLSICNLQNCFQYILLNWLYYHRERNISAGYLPLFSVLWHHTGMYNFPMVGGVNISFTFRLAAQSPSAPVLCVARVKNSSNLHDCPLFHNVHKLWCWQPLQKQLNPVKYLGVLVGRIFSNCTHLQWFALLLFHVVLWTTN